MLVKTPSGFPEIICSFLILLLTSPSFPQQDSVINLTLNEAVKIALTNNRDVRIALEDLKKSEAQIDEAYADVWPSINASGEYTRNIKSPVLFIPPNTPFNPSAQTMTFSLGAKNSYAVAATLNQTLFSLKVNTAISIANDYHNYFKYAGKSAEDEVILSVKEAFYTILLAAELINVSQKSYEVAKANFENVKSQFTHGVSSEYDLLRAEVQLANVDPILIQAKNNFKLAKNGLKNLLGIDLQKDINVIGEFKLEAADPDFIKDENDYLLENNPMLTALEFQISVLEKNIKLETAGYFPTLSGFANYLWQTQDNSFDFSNYLWANTFTVGLRLSIPVFDGFRKNARIDQAIVEKTKLELIKLKAEEGLGIQLVQSQLKMQEARERVLAQEKSLTQAERAVQIAESRYNNGIGTQLEILDTQSSLTMSRTNYSQAIYDYLIAKALWEKIIGSSNK
jgi:outer membrane protein TolC